MIQPIPPPTHPVDKFPTGEVAGEFNSRAAATRWGLAPPDSYDLFGIIDVVIEVVTVVINHRHRRQAQQAPS